MRHRTKTLRQGRWYKLSKSTNPKTGRSCYTIAVDPYEAGKIPFNGNHTFSHDGTRLGLIRKLFDPAGNRGGKFGTRWKYGNKETAEKVLLMAMIKFGE
jgi:hypothetical protein